MNVYPIEGKITKAAILYLTIPLHTWYNKQKIKPKYCFNADLYNLTTRVPEGTVIRDGKMVRSQGNGFGFGILKDGSPAVGGLNMPWKDYFTGYNSYIQNGLFTSPSWRDKYVFEESLLRIAIAKKCDKWYVLTGIGTIATGWNGKEYNLAGSFTKSCMACGVDTVVGLDGGASVALNINGSNIYKSDRKPYSIIAFWTEEEDNGMKVVCGDKKIGTYDKNGKAESNRYISPGDTCEIDPQFVKITYPSGSSTRDAYIRAEDLTGFTKG